MLETVQSVPLTFFSRNFYIELARKWKGIGFGFIILLTLINVVWIGTRGYARLHEEGKILAATATAMPEFAFQDHKLSIDKPSPYTAVIFQSDQQANKLVIDTTLGVPDVSSLIKRMNKEKILVLLTADKVITQKTGGEVDINTYEKVSNQTITHEQWASFGKVIEKAFFPLCFICVALALFIGQFVVTLVAAVIGKLMAAMMDVTLEFSGAMRMAAATHMPIGIVAIFVAPPLIANALVWLGYGVFSLLSLRSAGKRSI